VLRLSKSQAGSGVARFALHVRHAARVRDLDAPQGNRYDGIFLLRLGAGGSKDWARLDRRILPHLSTPKDSQDTFDVLWGVETLAEGGRIGRLIIQGAHGPGGRAKKPRKDKARTVGAKTSRSSP
jgi:hypothetical protein